MNNNESMSFIGMAVAMNAKYFQDVDDFADIMHRAVVVAMHVHEHGCLTDDDGVSAPPGAIADVVTYAAAIRMSDLDLIASLSLEVEG